MMKRILITGVNGFVGRHMAAFCAQQESIELFGLGTRSSYSGNEPLSYYSCDLRDATRTKETIQTIQPEGIIHLAGQNAIGKSFNNPKETVEVNVTGVFHLLEAVTSLPCRVLLVSSAEVYAPLNRPLREDDACIPKSPYALSKMFGEKVGHLYHDLFDVSVIIARPFQHTGPGQRPETLLSRLAKKIADAENNRPIEPLRVWDTSLEKEVLDVRDVVRAYWLLLHTGMPGEVINISGGSSFSLQTLIDTLLSYTSVQIPVIKDPSFERKDEPRLFMGNPEKIRTLTDWEPTRDLLSHTLPDLLSYWRTVSGRAGSA